MIENRKIQLLDCTLRDGGYINNWNWGKGIAKSIIRLLTMSNIDIVEIGFLRNIHGFNEDVLVSDNIRDFDRYLPVNKRKTIFAVMVMNGNYDVEKLERYNGSGIELIRITFHEYDIEEGLKLAESIQNKGYKVSINPINIMGYSDLQLLEIIKKINKINPYQFSVVDTFGSMRTKDLDRIVGLIDHNLNTEIQLGLHLHENMSMSFSLAQSYIHYDLNRNISIDGSLSGMGRIPGNLPIELIVEYLNNKYVGGYDLDYILDAIYDYIREYHGKSNWGYMPEYFLSAMYNIHRNYSEYLLEFGNLTNKDIGHILSQVESNKSAVFDKGYIQNLYEEYMCQKLDDHKDRLQLYEELKGKNIFIIAPGASLSKNINLIKNIRNDKCNVLFTLNFSSADFYSDYAFFSNNKRFETAEIRNEKVIITSNISAKNVDYVLDYTSLLISDKYGYNSLVLLSNFFKQCGIETINIISADGYSNLDNNYYDSVFTTILKRDKSYNREIANALKSIGIKYIFVTPSEYEKYMENSNG